MLITRKKGDMQTLGQDSFSASVQGSAPARENVTHPAAGIACAMAARHVLELADNGDGTLTVVRCIDKAADDLDIQFEAGGCRLTLPGSVGRVGTLAFAKGAGLERVRIEPGVQALGPSCFSKCAALARVDIPSSVVQIGGGAFFGCGRQLVLHGAQDAPARRYAQLNGIGYDSESWREDETLVLEETEDGSLRVLGAREERPVRIEIPGELCGRAVCEIAPKAFFACGTLEQLVIGGNVRAIGESAFFGCRSMRSVSFERGLEHVCDSAFAGCENLTQVTLPWGTGSIGRMAFFGCSRLSFVKMPATTRVSDLAFDGCAPNLRVFGGVNAGRSPVAL